MTRRIRGRGGNWTASTPIISSFFTSFGNSQYTFQPADCEESFAADPGV